MQKYFILFLLGFKTSKIILYDYALNGSTLLAFSSLKDAFCILDAFVCNCFCQEGKSSYLWKITATVHARISCKLVPFESPLYVPKNERFRTSDLLNYSVKSNEAITVPWYLYRFASPSIQKHKSSTISVDCLTIHADCDCRRFMSISSNLLQ